QTELLKVGNFAHGLPEFRHTLMIVSRLELYGPVLGRGHIQADGMQRGHVDAGPEQKGLFVGTVIFPGPDVLRRGSDDVDKKTLMFLVIVSKEAADRIDHLVLILQQRTEIGFTSALVGGIVHSGFGFSIT